MWGLTGAVAATIWVTYARLPPEDTYHVSSSGLAGGAGRALVFLNFPVAFVAIAATALAADRLLAADRSLPRVVLPAALAVALCALVPVPGVVEQADLDAKVVNALPAAGVGLALLLTVAAARARVRASERPTGDRVRLALAAAVIAISPPWIAAEAGIYIGGPFYAEQRPPGEELAAVHLGHHHGFDGVLLTLSALLLSRQLANTQRGRLRRALSVYLAAMLAYGLANAIQDFWLEQLVKRGTVDWEVPSVLRPEPTLAWLVLLAGAAAIELWWFRRERPGRRPQLARSASA